MNQNLLHKNTGSMLLAVLILAYCWQSSVATFTYKYVNMNDFFTKKVLSCEVNTRNELRFYQDLYNLKSFAQKKRVFYAGAYKFIDVHAIDFVRDEHFVATNLDMNVKKYNLDIMRLSVFAEEMDGDESFGYYLILKGSLTKNRSVLESLSINTDYVILESTKFGNTRLKCILIG